MITNINEFRKYLISQQSSINEGITDKDWSRMMDLVMSNKDGEGVAKSIKDKNKAIARYVAGIKLAKKNPDYNEAWKKYMGWFSDFGNQALSLGATPEEIQAEFDNAEIPQKFLDKKEDLGTKKLDNRFVSAISKALLKAGYDIIYLNKGGNALTSAGIEAMSRNGRKWTIGYKSQILANGKTYEFIFDAITDEGDGPTKYAVDTQNSDNIFSRLSSWKGLGQREFIEKLLASIAKDAQA